MEDASRAGDIADDISGWLARVNEPGFAAWEEFGTWQSPDAGRANRNWRSAEMDQVVRDHLFRLKPVPASVVTSTPAPKRWWLKWSVAGGVALAAAAIFGLLPSQGSTRYQIETALGQRRSVALAGVGRIDLNGASKITLDRSASRTVQLDRGEALITVTHDPARSFTLGTVGIHKTGRM